MFHYVFATFMVNKDEYIACLTVQPPTDTCITEGVQVRSIHTSLILAIETKSVH